MPLIDLQRRFRELGRLRMGAVQVPAQGKPRPIKLETWRMTSSSEALLQAAAEVYGGQVRRWENAPTDGDHFELFTEARSLPIVVPPGETVLSQWYELWSGGGCKRRCGGPNEEQTSRQALRDVPCACPLNIAERMELAGRGQACKPTTRLNVILPEIPDVGVWRLESHGYYAATELAGSYDLCRQGSAHGYLIAARLTIQPREVKKENEPTKKFMVPIIEIEERIGDVVEAIGAAAQLPPIQRRALNPAQPAVLSDNAPGSPAPGLTEGASFPAASAPLPIEAEVVPSEEEAPEEAEIVEELPAWILELPGNDGAILDAAMQVASAKGRPQEIRSLIHLASLDISVAGQKDIRLRMMDALAEQEEPSAEQGRLG